MPGPVAFAFGSFGDIVTILQLAWSLRKLLSDVGGASQEVQTIISDIDAFMKGMEAVKATLSQTSITPSIELQLDFVLQRCRHILDLTNKRVAEFNIKTSRAVGVRVMREYWKLCAWDIFGGKQEVNALLRRLSDSLLLIQTLLGASQR